MRKIIFAIVSTLALVVVSGKHHHHETNPVQGTKQCSDRGGCYCDCSWASSQTCGKDDGSCCFGCCCGSTPVPPSPPPPPVPPGPAGSYCPSANDLIAGYGNPQIVNRGWTVTAGGSVATKAAFNLLGGSVEYDVDFSGTKTGVNANIYTISPANIGSYFNQGHYCDGAKYGNDWCVEVDWIETNGNCGGQTTLHTVQGPGNDGCTAWGCANSYHYNGKSKFHMKITYDADGTWRTYRDGQLIGPQHLSPQPKSSDVAKLKEQYSQRGAVIYSSQWVGWVPVSDCGSSGDLNSSRYTISNLVINGKVVQGPTPTKC